MEQLHQNNQLKQECLLELDQNIHERNTLLTRLGVAPNRQSVINFIHTLSSPTASMLEQRWQKLEESLEQVRTLNLRNEQVLLHSKKNTDQLLTLLQGHSRSNTIYNHKGDKGHYEAQRSLGKA